LALAPEGPSQEVGQAMVEAWEARGVTSRHAVLSLQHSGSAWTALPAVGEAPVTPSKPKVASAATKGGRSKGR
jgi:hypothetical protein